MEISPPQKSAIKFAALIMFILVKLGGTSLSNLKDDSVEIFRCFELFRIDSGLNEAHSNRISFVSKETEVLFPPIIPARATGPIPSEIDKLLFV